MFHVGSEVENDLYRSLDNYRLIDELRLFLFVIISYQNFLNIYKWISIWIVKFLVISRIVPFYKNVLNMQVSVFIPICSRLVFTIFIHSSAQMKYNSARFLIVRTKAYLFMCNVGNKPIPLALPQTSVRLFLAKWKGNALVMDLQELVIWWN